MEHRGTRSESLRGTPTAAAAIPRPDFGPRPMSRASNAPSSRPISSIGTSRQEADEQRQLDAMASEAYREAKKAEHEERHRDSIAAVRLRNDVERQMFDDSRTELKEALKTYEHQQQRQQHRKQVNAHNAKFATLMQRSQKIKDDRIERVARRNFTKQALEESGLATIDALVQEQQQRGMMLSAHLNTSAVREHSVQRMVDNRRRLDEIRKVRHPSMQRQLLHELGSPMTNRSGPQMPSPQKQSPSHTVPSSRGSNGLSSLYSTPAMSRSLLSRPVSQQLNKKPLNPPTGNTSSVMRPGVMTPTMQFDASRPTTSQAGRDPRDQSPSVATRNAKKVPQPSDRMVEQQQHLARTALLPPLPDLADDDQSEDREGTPKEQEPSPSSHVGDPFPEVDQTVQRIMQQKRTGTREGVPKGSIHAQKAAKESKLFIRQVVAEARRNHQRYREDHPSPVRPKQGTQGVFEGAQRAVGNHSPDRNGRSANTSALSAIAHDNEYSTDSGLGAGYFETEGGLQNLQGGSGGNSPSSASKNPTFRWRRISQIEFALSRQSKTRSQLQVASGFAKSWISKYKDEQLERQRVAEEHRKRQVAEYRRARKEREDITAMNKNLTTFGDDDAEVSAFEGGKRQPSGGMKRRYSYEDTSDEEGTTVGSGQYGDPDENPMTGGFEVIHSSSKDNTHSGSHHVHFNEEFPPPPPDASMSDSSYSESDSSSSSSSSSDSAVEDAEDRPEENDHVSPNRSDVTPVKSETSLTAEPSSPGGVTPNTSMKVHKTVAEECVSNVVMSIESRQDGAARTLQRFWRGEGKSRAAVRSKRRDVREQDMLDDLQERVAFDQATKSNANVE